MQSDLVSTLDALYAIDAADDTAWMRAIVRAMPPLVAKPLGTTGLMYDLTVTPPRLWALVNESSPLEPDVLTTTMNTATPAYTRAIAGMPVATASEGPDYDSQPFLEDIFRPRGIEDVLTINAFNPNGIGCSVAQTVSKRLALKPKQREAIKRFASHLASAARLRWRIRRLPQEKPDAVLTRSGKTLHAEGDAKLATARAALKHAAMQIDRARSERGDANETLDRWRPLVAAKWTLVDHFEQDGKQYLVARSNEAMREGISALTTRERQVVAMLALGHHPKLIAYELGISSSTVRVLLARASHRAGARSRDELVKLLNTQ